MSLPLVANSDDFVFDNEIIIQAIAGRLRIGEISCPTSYHADASSINLARSVTYGIGVIRGSLEFAAWRLGMRTPRILEHRIGDTLEYVLASGSGQSSD
jgi:hypothetical protein